MDGFVKQLKEDIEELQEQFGNIVPKKYDDNWWLNFWVLEKYFHVDGNLVPDNITENNDGGIDCFYYDEDGKNLYLIQNKYYLNSTITYEYVENWLSTVLTLLDNNKYTRSIELQDIYNNVIKDPEGSIILEVYVTNNNISTEIKNLFKQYNQGNKNVARIYGLTEMKDKYYAYEELTRKEFNMDFKTRNQKTMLNVDSENYDIDVNLDSRFVMMDIAFIHKLIKKATDEGYPIFDENIREYLGQNNINKKIKNTLIDENDRKNFFYYNNGITIVCEEFGRAKATFNVKNPQIVNGCQTSSTIYEVLETYKNPDVDFKDSYVMVKLLKIPKNDELLKNIVLYNNSQNKVDEKHIEAQRSELNRISAELRKHGLLVIQKQSDKNTYKKEYANNYKELEKLLPKAFVELISPAKYTDLYVEIEKLLQVVLCVRFGADKAYKEKSKILKKESKINIDVMNELLNTDITTNYLINLWTLFSKLEKDKKINTELIPFYVITFLQTDIGLTDKNLQLLLENPTELDLLIRFYHSAIKQGYQGEMHEETNKMIKSNINYEIVKKSINTARGYRDDVCSVIEKYKS